MSQPARRNLVVQLVIVATVVVAVIIVVAMLQPTNKPKGVQTAGLRSVESTVGKTSGTLYVLKIPSLGHVGSADEVGCGDDLWRHVYNPERLTVFADCLTITGVIVDATAGTSHPRQDGVRKERDGDTHGWLRVDPTFENLVNQGNESNEEGNLVFEIVCFWSPAQLDAKPTCAPDYRNRIALPPIGAHVAITGTYVQDHNHAHWMEIHPVSGIQIKQ